MGVIEKDAVRTMIISYMGLVLGYLNKGVLFIVFLSVEEIGLISLLLSIGILFSQFSNLGTINTLLRFFPYFNDKEKQHFGFFQLIFMTASLGVLITGLAVLFFYDEIVYFYARESPLFVAYYFWIVPIGIANLLYFLLETYLKGLMRNVIAVFIREIVLRLMLTVAIVLYGLNLLSFHNFVVINCLMYFVPLFLLLAYTIKIGHFPKWNAKIQVPKRFRKILFKYSLYNYANTLGSAFIATLDMMMIAAFLGVGAAGIYATVIYLSSALQVPYRSLMRIAVPFVPLYWKEKRMGEMGALYKSVSSINLVVALFMFLCVWVNIDELFGLLPEQFEPGIWVFFFIMCGRIVDMYFGINGYILLNSKKYSIDLLFTICLIVLVFVLNYYLIPIYGIAGAAISTMAGVILYNLFRLVYVWYHFGLHPFRSRNIIAFILCGITILCCYWVPDLFGQWYLRIIQNLLIVLALFVLPTYFLKVDIKFNEYLSKLTSKFL